MSKHGKHFVRAVFKTDEEEEFHTARRSYEHMMPFLKAAGKCAFFEPSDNVSDADGSDVSDDYDDLFDE